MSRKITILLFSLLIILAIIQFIERYYRSENGDFTDFIVSILVYKIYPILVNLLLILLLIRKKSSFYLGIWTYIMVLFTVLLINLLFDVFSPGFEWSSIIIFAVCKLFLYFGLLISLFKLMNENPTEPFSLRFTAKRMDKSNWDKGMHASIILALIFGWPYALSLIHMFTRPMSYLHDGGEALIYGSIFVTYLIGLIAKNRFLYLAFFLLIAVLIWTFADYILAISTGFIVLDDLNNSGSFAMLFVIFGAYILIALIVILSLAIPVLKKINELKIVTDPKPNI